MQLKQVAVLVLFLGSFCIPSHCQVVAFWTDSNGNWSNSANWSSCFPAACPVVPNNSGGITYDAVIPSGDGFNTVTVTFDASGTVVDSLALFGGNTLQDNGHSQTLTLGKLLDSQSADVATINWGNGSVLRVIGSMNGGFFSNTNVYGGSLLSIGGDFTGNSHLGILTVSNSTLKVQGSYFNGSDSGDLFNLTGSMRIPMKVISVPG